jgi:hypothetical protein
LQAIRFDCGGTDVRGNYIDGIAEYCDRWCEHCALTARCSAYAVQIATAMCEGDVESGIELAVGAPPPQDEAEELQRDERIAEFSIVTRSEAVSRLVHRWIGARYEPASKMANAGLIEALEITSRDGFSIHVKLLRALDGRDRMMHGEDVDEGPIQNDWNGSAKVALISIIRSIAAWSSIADATDDSDARYIAEALAALRGEVEVEFPDAWRFVRPGFDREL